MDLPREFRFDFTPEDYLRFNLDHDAGSKELRASFLRGGAFVTVLVLAIFVLFLARSQDPGLTAQRGWPWLLVIPLYWYFILRGRPRAVRQGVQRLLATDEGRVTLVGPRRAVVSDAGLRWEAEHSSVEISWKGVTRVVRSSDHLYLYFSPVQAVVLPRRIFKTDDAFDAFAADAERRVAAARDVSASPPPSGL